MIIAQASDDDINMLLAAGAISIGTVLSWCDHIISQCSQLANLHILLLYAAVQTGAYCSIVSDSNGQHYTAKRVHCTLII